MKGNQKTYHTIEEIADEALFDLQESAHRKEQFLHWAIRWYKRYRMDMAREIRTVTLSMTSWKSIELPDDCVDWIAMGIKCGQTLKTFVNDPKIISRDCTCDKDAPEACDLSDIDVSGEGVQWWGINELGEDVGKMFGLMVKDNGFGYFSVNKNQDVPEIQFSSNVDSTSQIYLMYLSNLFDPKRSTVVHPYAKDMLVLACHYENLLFKVRNGSRNTSLALVRDAKDALDEEICKTAERAVDWNVESILQVIRNATYLAPKL